ncbi:MAG: ABC transporter permease, partial [Clostridia bacterium]
AIRGLEGVAAAEPVWQTVGKAGSGEENEDVTVISITEEVNLPMVLEGRLPEDPGECAVEKRLMDKFGWAIGETIAVTSADGEMPQYLLNSTFRITCVANHPDHMNTAAPDTLYIMLPRRAFDLDALENCSVKAEIILEKGADLSLFEEEYTSLADGMKKNLEALASEREQIRDREVLAKALSELDENAKMVDLKKMLSDAEETLDALQPARWILLRVMDNTSFAWQHGIITQTSQIQAVFSTFFLIISILVIYASVQKLVLEQRTLVGMGKALGLYNREILLKYLLFGLLGTTAGIILGTAAAYFVLQPLVLGTTNLFVLFDISRPLFDARSVLLTAAFLELVTFLSVYVACKALLRSSATVLMRTQVPKYQNKAAGRGSRHIPLMIRMIPRGMRANPGRVLVTIVSVAGCCALVVMGLTTKNRLDGVLTHQYPGITDYDLEVTFDGSADARDGIEEVLRSEGTEYVLVGSESVICEENGRTAAVLVTGSLEEIDAFYHLRDHHTGEPLPLNRKGCYIHRCFAEEFQLSPGDTVAVTLGLDTQARFSVGAVYDNYLGWNFFLCDADYEEAFGKASIKNQYYVRLGAADEALLKERLAKVPGFGKIDASDSDKEIFLSVSSTMNMLVVLMIVLAGILAAFVIVSLTKCYLLQKNNEAMIMRINGFTFREVIIYLMAEIIADTILGILLGFVVGQVLSVYMLSQMEADFYRTIRGIDVPAMILGAGITALFSLAVNAVCLRPLKRMKLTDLA